MNSKRCFYFLAGLIVCLAWQSCQEQVAKQDTSLLNGKWLVVSATRNANPTTTLNEAFFEFAADSTMQSNLTGEAMRARYSVSGNTINQISESALSYDILKISADTLVLKTKILDYDFKLLLVNERLDPFDKLEDESEEPDDQEADMTKDLDS